MPDADFISLEWDEGRWLVLRLLVDGELNADGTVDLRLSDPVEFYRAVRQSCDTWIAEMEEARAMHAAGVRPDGRLSDAEREEEIRCSALGLEGPNAKQWRWEQTQ